MHDKLLKIQKELKAPKNQINKFGGYNYRSCEDILQAAKPLCNGESLTLHLQDEIVEVCSRVYVKATAWVSDGTEKVECVAYAREEESKKGMDGSQITGAASSYARKYALNGLFAIDDAKDSDSDEHTKQTTAAPAQTPKKRPVPDKVKVMHELKRLGFTFPAEKEKAGRKIREIVLVLTDLDVLNVKELPQIPAKLAARKDAEGAQAEYGMAVEDRVKKQFEEEESKNTNQASEEKSTEQS